MTQTFNLRSLTVASAFALAASLAMFAQASTASAKNVLNCRGDTRAGVLECCNEIVERKGMPVWMIQTGQNCKSIARSARCVSKQGSSITAAVVVQKCKIVFFMEEDSGDKRTTPKGKRPNGRPQTHGKF